MDLRRHRPVVTQNKMVRVGAVNKPAGSILFLSPG